MPFFLFTRYYALCIVRALLAGFFTLAPGVSKNINANRAHSNLLTQFVNNVVHINAGWVLFPQAVFGLGRQIRSRKILQKQLYKPLWEYVPITQFSRPTAPMRENVRHSCLSWLSRLQPQLFRRNQFFSMPPYLLNRAAPAPDSAQILTALTQALRGWELAKEPEQMVQVLVAPPGSGIEQATTKLARKNGWQIMGAPSVRQILAGGEAWLEQVTRPGLTPLVIPRLGKCYLRHQEGLELLSRFLDWLQTTRRRCLIVCDSWAWAYLKKALQIDVMVPSPLTLAPFDGAKLQFWLPFLANRIHNGRFHFRHVEDGALIFPLAETYNQAVAHYRSPGQIERYGDWVSVHHFFRQLAAYGRGLPGVIWQVWRQSLEMIHENRQDGLKPDDMLDDDKRYTVWVQTWSRLQLPTMPGGLGTNESLVLHTTLLHGGISAELIADLTPLSHNEVRRILQMFWRASLLEKEEDRWQVPLLAYPTVRSFLANEGYLVDEF
ncbi:MAG: hypothetical protein IPM53_18920 [Anaerolineaceae bacterium]|nr:hypothetical protein [Anaerolineaceae bacterium]